MSPPVNYCRRLSIASLIDHFLRRVDVGRHSGQAMGQGTYCSHYFNTPSFMSNLINAMIANLLGWGFFPSQGTAVAVESTSFRGGKGGMSKAWQQALISTTIFAWAEFLPTENCHSGELCTGGLIVGLRGGAPRGKHGILLHNLLLLPLYLSRPFLANSLSFCILTKPIQSGWTNPNATRPNWP